MSRSGVIADSDDSFLQGAADAAIDAAEVLPASVLRHCRHVALRANVRAGDGYVRAVATGIRLCPASAAAERRSIGGAGTCNAKFCVGRSSVGLSKSAHPEVLGFGNRF